MNYCKLYDGKSTQKSLGGKKKKSPMAKLEIYLADLNWCKSLWLVLGLAASLVCLLNDFQSWWAAGNARLDRKWWQHADASQTSW